MLKNLYLIMILSNTHINNLVVTSTLQDHIKKIKLTCTSATFCV